MVTYRKRMLTFYPTYEELKLYNSGKDAFDFYAFYPTYEELKFVGTEPGSSPVSSFYPTYEELKYRSADSGNHFGRRFLSYL